MNKPQRCIIGKEGNVRTFRAWWALVRRGWRFRYQRLDRTSRRVTNQKDVAEHVLQWARRAGTVTAGIPHWQVFGFMAKSIVLSLVSSL